MTTDPDIAWCLRHAIAQKPPAQGDTYRVYHRRRLGTASLLVGLSPSGASSLLLVDALGQLSGGFSTSRLLVKCLERAHIQAEGEAQRVAPALVLECSDPTLVDAFGAMGEEILVLRGAEETPAWAEVLKLLRHWSKLFAESTRLAEERLVGLWGELQVLAASQIPDKLLDAWRGPSGGVADFVFEGASLEVKTSRRPLIHQVSHAQVQLAPEHTFFLSLNADASSGGKKVADLVQAVAARVKRPALLFGALAAQGVSLASLRETEEQRWSLIGEPLLFPGSAIPRVTAMDAGVSDVKYRVTLRAEAALRGTALATAAASFGLAPFLAGGKS